MRAVAAAAVTSLLVLSLTGCEMDDRRCLESHTDFMPITQVTAQGQPYITYMPMDVCDRYEEKPAQ